MSGKEDRTKSFLLDLHKSSCKLGDSKEDKVIKKNEEGA
jgi:hypothetical protein